MENSKNPVILKAESWKMFDTISVRYDFLNRVLSLGQDIRWRRQLPRYLPPGENLTVLDLATGTADVAITLAQSDPRVRTVHGVDMAEKMLVIADRKVEAARLKDRIILQKGDAQALPFVNDTFDAAAIAFGIRNVGDLRLGLMEMYRVLKKGGRILVLEFSIPDNTFLRAGHRVYLNWIVPAVGFLLSGNGKAYRYLNQTILSFPYGERFCKILKQMGFTRIHAHPLMGGAATIYVGEK